VFVRLGRKRQGRSQGGSLAIFPFETALRKIVEVIEKGKPDPCRDAVKNAIPTAAKCVTLKCCTTNTIGNHECQQEERMPSQSGDYR
jgi:hypothetical protein